MLNRPSRQGGWLGAPEGVSLSDIDDSFDNPFIRFRKFLWSHHAAMQRGMGDPEFVDLARRLDESVAEVDGRGFVVTPHLELAQLAQDVGLQHLFAKNETQNVAGSHKARHLFGLALHLEVNQVPASQPLAIASCGNAALGAAVVARALGRQLEVFAPVSAEEFILGELDRLGANVNLCERLPGESGDPSFLRFREALAAGALAFSVQGPENIFTLDGGRCLGWELAESFAARNMDAQEMDGHGLFIQIGGGALASSVIQGLSEARDLELLSALPAVFCVQTSGCAPLARALGLILSQQTVPESYSQNSVGPGSSSLSAVETVLEEAESDPGKYMWPWESEPHSIASGILDDETYDWLPLIWGMIETGGGALVVGEEILEQASDLASRHSGSEVGPTGAAGLAGALELALGGNHEEHNSVLLFDQQLDGATVLLTGRT